VVACLGLKVGESGLRYSLDQSSRELLYLPVARTTRVRSKAFIDVFVQRSAKGLAALLLLPVALGVLHPAHLGWLTALVATIWLGVAARVYGTYVSAFRSGLKERTVDSAVPIDIADVRTVELLVQSLSSADSRQVLHSLEILESNNRANLIPPLLLYHDDPAVRKRTLQVLAELGRKDASHLIERRLSDHDADVRAEAIRVLTEFNAEEACTLMIPRLRESDPRVRAAAVTCLLSYGDPSLKEMARRALKGMLSEDLPDLRAEAVRALGAIHGSEFEGQLLESLDDPSSTVGREAIASIQRVVARDGFHPIFVPKLVSLLQNRRLKHNSRNALVVFGQDALPALVHFMNDPGESIAVRRALPRVIARIGGSSAIESLLAAMENVEDSELRSQLVEALSYRRRELLEANADPRIEEYIEKEVEGYMSLLSDLVAIGGLWGVQMDGISIRRNLRDAGLLTQILAERLEDQVKNIFGLLAIIHPPSDVWASYRSLKSGQKEQRAHALEFLDNTLTGEVRRRVFTIIDDSPISDKLRQAYKSYGLQSRKATQTVSRYLDNQHGENADSIPLAVAGIYTVYTDRITELYSRVRELACESEDEFVKETAEWVTSQLGS
jgi:AAA family ATP:ADP antiporter